MTENPKNKIRLFLKALLAKIPPNRRVEGQREFFLTIVNLITDRPFVLSFASFRDEIDTSLVNQFLATTGRLLLPKICGTKLLIYHVKDPSRDLLINEWGIAEPDPKWCQEISADQIETILVPALGFDQKKNRIGYGKGFYDRFLSLNPEIKTYGVGFKEQIIEKLPVTTLDIPLDSLLLF